MVPVAEVIAHLRAFEGKLIASWRDWHAYGTVSSHGDLEPVVGIGSTDQRRILKMAQY